MTRSPGRWWFARYATRRDDRRRRGIRRKRRRPLTRLFWRHVLKSRTDYKPSRLVRLMRGASAMTTLTLVVFLIINVTAHLIFLALRGDRVRLDDYFLSPLSEPGMEILKQVFDSQDEDFLRALADGDPGIRPHTVLHFTEGLSRLPHYRIGLEGLRYQPEWTDEQVRNWLSEPQRHTFLLGGSTAFGHGVPGDQTVAAHLNRLDGPAETFNFAVQAYDSIRETDKLVYLLRKGYRPGRVIFLDGLNDVTTFAWSPYEAFDKPRTQGLILDRGQVPLIFGHPRRNNMPAALAFSFPIVQLFHRLQGPRIDGREYQLKSAGREPFDWGELMLFYERWDRIQEKRADDLADELASYYRRNIEFVRKLGRAFGFSCQFVYQPIGLLEEDQPFLKPALLDSRVRLIYETARQKIRAEIQAGRLSMADCSASLSGSTGMYVDATHYSPPGNAKLAKCIAEAVEASIPGSSFR